MGFRHSLQPHDEHVENHQAEQREGQNPHVEDVHAGNEARIDVTTTEDDLANDFSNAVRNRVRHVLANGGGRNGELVGGQEVAAVCEEERETKKQDTKYTRIMCRNTQATIMWAPQWWTPRRM